MLFSSTEQSKKEIKKLENTRKRIQAFQEQSSEIMEELKENDPEAYVQANYLYHAAGMPCRRANAVYYRLGEELRAEGISCIPSNKFRVVLSRIHNNRDHRKITVIDGTTGFCGGVNLADEYINDFVKYGYWKDTAVKIEGDAVRNLTALFIELWNMQNTDQNRFIKRRWGKTYI